MLSIDKTAIILLYKEGVNLLFSGGIFTKRPGKASNKRLLTTISEMFPLAPHLYLMAHASCQNQLAARSIISEEVKKKSPRVPEGIMTEYAKMILPKIELINEGFAPLPPTSPVIPPPLLSGLFH
ncbi:hypothetical protein [Botryobacter ruber]|uniref:hypothetical protein n=1 Tax=Botryobacter ruber TaxID=2171629 RepID=UPI000F652500|nr:hypothetical protein [Botryobacter ruber]